MREKFTALSLLGCCVLAAQTKPPNGMPAVMQVCVAVCAQLEWTGGRYENFDLQRRPHTVYEVESFTPNSFVIKRTELAIDPAYGLTAVYRGTFTEGDDTARGTVEFTWPGQAGYPHSAKWTARGLEPPDYLFIDPHAPCGGPLERGDQKRAEAHAVRAMDAKDYPLAACWLNRASDGGDANAEGMLATLLYLGTMPGVSADYKRALTLARDAAEQGNYLGERCLSRLYATGRGLPKDAAQAAYWSAKADRDKQAAILAEQRRSEQRWQAIAQAHRMQAGPRFSPQTVGALMVLGLVLGAMGDSGGGASSGDSFDEQMSRGYRNMCIGGDSHACGMAH